MKQRATEILFRNKFLILLPLVIIMPLTIVLASRPRPVTWQSFAVVSVDQARPLYEDPRLVWNPAAAQATLLNDFLRTRTFARAVLDQTDIGPLIDSPQAELWAISRLWRSVRVAPNSTNFLTIIVEMPEPGLAQQTAQAIVTTFQDELRNRTESQNGVTNAYFAQALAKAEDSLNRSRRELSNYLAARPELQRVDGSSSAIAARDPTLAKLYAQVSYDDGAYTSARGKYEQALATGSASLEGQPLSFTVVDEPQVPINPLRARRLTLLKLPAIGAVLGLMLSSSIAALLVLSNRAVLGVYDVQTFLGLPVLGEVPELRRRRIWQRRPKHAVRMRLAGPARLGEPSASRG